MMKKDLKGMFIRKVVLLLLVIGFLALSAFSAATTISKVAIVSADSGQVVSLGYVPLTDSYQDDGSNNPNVFLRVYASEKSGLDKYVGLVYSDIVLQNYILISPDIQGSLDKVGYYQKTVETSQDGYYIDTDISISTSYAKFPGIIYALISDDPIPSSDDLLIQLDPVQSGWLEGTDGGYPCFKLGDYWVTDKNDMCALVDETAVCPCSDSGAEEYDSFDVSWKKGSGELSVAVTAAYFLNEQNLAEEIENSGRVILELREDDRLIGSQAVSLLEEAVFDISQVSSSFDVYVNGIRTDRVLVSTNEGSSDASYDLASSLGSSQSGSPEAKDALSPEASEEGACADMVVFYPEMETEGTVRDYDADLGDDSGKTFYCGFEIENPGFQKALVKFSVPRSWARQRNEAQISLYQKQEGWQKINTALVDEDYEALYFASEVDSGGIFAYGIDAIFEPDMPEEIGAVPLEDLAGKESSSSDDFKRPLSLHIIITLIVVMLLVLALVLYLILKKKTIRQGKR